MAKFLRKAGFPVLMLIMVGILFSSASTFAITAGKISGVVTDAQTGEPLPGVNVVIEGTTLGSTTDLEGRYFIINVPPGRYDLAATYIGYTKVNKRGILVQSNMTSQVNFEMSQTVIEGEEVTVVAERPLVEPTLTQSKSTVGVEELDNTLPISGVDELVETAASTFKGYVRGGRKYETKTLVDGVDVSDTYFSGGTGAFGTDDVGHSYQGFRRSDTDETTATGTNSTSIQEMNVYAGTFTAEFPTASAGIINMVTKSGADKYTGKIYVRGTPSDKIEHFGSNVYWMKDTYGNTNGYFDRKKVLENSDAIFDQRRAQLYDWTLDKAVDEYNYDPEDSTGLGRSVEVQGNLSGPLPFTDGKGSFFLSGSYSDMRTSAMPFDESKRINLTAKINYALASDMSLTAYGQIDDGGQLFNFVNWKFNPKWAYYKEGAPRYKDLGTVSYLKFTHTLSPKTFYELQLSNVTKTTWIGYPDDNEDGFSDLDETGDFIDFDSRDEYLYYLGGVTKTDEATGETYIDWQTVDGYVDDWRQQDENTDVVLPRKDPNRRFFYETVDPASGYNESKSYFGPTGGWYRTGHPPPLYSETTRNNMTVKGDLTSQVTFNHQVKTGLQFKYHTIDVEHKQAELGGAGRRYPYSAFHVDTHEFNPMEFAYYLQDRIEYRGMIVNIGARVDAYNNDTQKFINDFHPWDAVFSESGPLLELIPQRGEDVGWKWYLSPRLGVSHPISDRMAMHYSFGQFIQYPNFASLYTDYNFTNYSASPSMVSVWPEQEPMKSTSYEIGLQWSPFADIAMDGVVYYRDVENYSNVSFSLIPYAGQAIRFQTTWGHADSRGVELTVEKRRSGMWSARATYSYSYVKSAQNRGGEDESQRRNFVAAVDSAKYAELPIDNANELNYREQNITVRSTRNPLAGGYDRTHRLAGTLLFYLPYDVNIAAIGTAQSGFKYFLTENTDEDPWFDVAPPLQEGPWNYWLNLRLSWEGKFGGIRIRPFAEVRNVTNHKNILAYNNTPFSEATDQKIWELGRDQIPDTGDEEDPEGINRLPHDVMGRLLYGPARQVWAGIELGF
jgi:hypothetical protein